MIRGAINQINKKIQSLENERKMLQMNCKHKNPVDALWSWRSQKAKICGDCDKLLTII